jgi:hypothetical protein
MTLSNNSPQHNMLIVASVNHTRLLLLNDEDMEETEIKGTI